MTEAHHDLRALIADVPDVPEPGILFRDVTPLLADGAALTTAIDRLVDLVPGSPSHIVGIESRGFIFGALLADRLNVGFVPVRKPGKLPRAVHGRDYELEYGPPGRLELHRDALGGADSVVVVDDVLATGGTAAATIDLVGQAGAVLLGAVFLIELDALGGRSRLNPVPTRSLLHY